MLRYLPNPWRHNGLPHQIQLRTIDEIFIRTSSAWTKPDVIHLNPESADCSLPAQKKPGLDPANDAETETRSDLRTRVVNEGSISKFQVPRRRNTEINDDVIKWKHFLCFTCPLCGEFTGRRWIPLTKSVKRSLMFSLRCARINC